MKKLRHWLIRKFLPAWCREELLAENRNLQALADSQAQEIRRLKAYIDGMQTALRLGKRVTIMTGGGKQ